MLWFSRPSTAKILPPYLRMFIFFALSSELSTDSAQRPSKGATKPPAPHRRSREELAFRCRSDQICATGVCVKAMFRDDWNDVSISFVVSLAGSIHSVKIKNRGFYQILSIR